MNTIRMATLGGVGALGFALTMAQAVADSADVTLSEADKAALFKAAGAVQRKGIWVICEPPADSGAPASEGATIDTVRDLNGDGRPEAVVSDGGLYCYGHAGTGFQLLSRQANGSWKVMTGNNGMPEFLKTKGKDGWPDISVGGPGFCFPVQRWNGKTYELNRFEYEGKRCKPTR
jgi:hypothetical protein